MYDQDRLKSRKCLTSLHISELYVQIWDLHVLCSIIQSELGHLTFSNGEGNYFGCSTLLPHDTCSFASLSCLQVFQIYNIMPSKTLYLVMALGLRLFCFSFLKCNEVFLCSCHTLPFFSFFNLSIIFILIHVNLMRLQFGSLGALLSSICIISWVSNRFSYGAFTG